MELYQILDALYARYQEKQPGEIQYVFPPGAAAEDIAAAETALGMSLPDELRALYARHAYMTDAWEGVCINPVRAIAESRRSLEDVASNMAEDAAQDENANPEPVLAASGPVAPVINAGSRIPFGSQGNTDLLIDLQPPAGGTQGQIVRLDIEFGTIEVVANSLTEFFQQGLEAFSKERPTLSGKSAWLAQQLMRLLALPTALVMTAGAMLLTIAIITWGTASIVSDSIVGLFRRKQE